MGLLTAGAEGGDASATAPSAVHPTLTSRSYHAPSCSVIAGSGATAASAAAPPLLSLLPPAEPCT
jgi:hypothetical protein